jgi:hypothetical protein
MLSYSSLSGALAAERERAVREKARSAWQRRQRGELKFRDATDDDAPALLRLARLDSQTRPPSGRLIVAIDRGELVAAMAVDSGATIADPFTASAPVVALLRLRAEQLRPRSQRRTVPSLRRLRLNPARSQP